jgi:hypothetical protein
MYVVDSRGSLTPLGAPVLAPKSPLEMSVTPDG